MIRPEPRTEIDAGKTVAFTCVAFGVPLPTIMWSQGGVILTNDTDTRITIYSEQMEERGLVFFKSVLEICSAAEDDSGQYSCTAENEVGNDTAVFELDVSAVSLIGKRARSRSLVCDCIDSVTCFSHRTS